MLGWGITLIICLVGEGSGLGRSWRSVGGLWEVGRSLERRRLSVPLLLGGPISGGLLLLELFLPEPFLLRGRLGDLGVGTDGTPPVS